jgi:transcriptional regulator with XRE-family HTH domain
MNIKPNSAGICTRVGRNIFRWRRARGKTQEVLAGLAGIDRGYLNAIEKGSQNMTIMVLEKIAIALEVTVQDLLE